MNDEDLILAAVQGDGTAFTELYGRYYSRLVRYFRGWGIGEHDAEDLVAEVFLRILDHAAQFNPHRAGFR
jgi:DNA-directed RNA polymerase specialized sigma24 family protein